MKEEEAAGDISVLPEGCISAILSFTSPRDACTSSLISSTFKSAADSDVVWDKFLPNDYKDIAARAVPELDLTKFGSKKELYFKLCDEPLFFDTQNKSLSLEKVSGKKCFMIGAKELRITWVDTPQYWTWTSEAQSRFAEVAQLLDVCWLLIEGTIDTRILSPKTTYVVYLVVKFAENTYGLDHPPAEVSVKFAGGGGSASGSRTVYLDPQNNRAPRMQLAVHRLGIVRRRFGHILRPALSSETETQRQTETRARYEGQFPRERGDGWMEVEMGEFYNEEGEDGKVEVSLGETKGGQWKCGLIVQGIEVRPKKISS